MTIFDIVLAFILFGFTWCGLWYGLINTIGSILGVIIGAWIAGRYFEYLASFSSIFSFSNSNLVKVVSFLIIFFVVSKLVSFVFSLLDKMFEFISIIPFLKSINRLLGAILGFLEGMMILGLIFYFYSKYPFWNVLNNLIINSQAVPYFLKFAKILLPFLPEVLKQIETILNFKFNFSW